MAAGLEAEVDCPMIYDITRTVQPSLAVWPGDEAYHVSPVLKIADGASVNLTTITLSPHTGAHADAYFHYEADGEHPAAMPLDAYIGPARMVTVTKRNGALLPEDFAGVSLVGAQRVLIHSHVSDEVDDGVFPAEFPYLSVPLIEAWVALGIVLIGLDSPSVDDFSSKDLPCHHALRRHGLVNLESLYLRGIPDGDYELIALPLKLDLACGSPVRAILRRG
ncbi:MAG: cyclase family protein [Anaerolineae bacterium]